MSPQHFDHYDDAYSLSIRVQTTLNHIRFVKYAIGGYSEGFGYLEIVERFDPTKNAWDKLSSMHEKRASASGTVIRQKVFVFGGLSPRLGAEEPCEMYDPDTNIWSNIASEIAPRNFSSALSFHGKIYVIGYFQNEESRDSRSLYLYDTEKNEWKFCRCFVNVSHEKECYQISTLRISRDVLAKCKKM